MYPLRPRLHQLQCRRYLVPKCLYSTASGEEVRKATAYCSDLLQKYDSPSYTLSAFLPPHTRPAYLAIRTFNLELARIPDTSSTPPVLRMRYQFFRDLITSSFAHRPPNHPLAILLSSSLHSLSHRRHHQAPVTLSKTRFLRLITAREARALNPPYPTLSDLEAYAESTYSALLYLTLQSLPLYSLAADHIASHVGKAAGIVAVVRGIPLLAFPPPPNHHSNAPNLASAGGGVSGRQQQGVVTLPLDVMAEAGVREEDVLRQGAEAMGLRDAVFQVATRASDHLITARQMLKNVREGRDVGHEFEHEGEEGHDYYGDREGIGGGGKSGQQKQEMERAFGVFMPAVSTELWLQRLERLDFDVFREELRRREWRLPWKAWLAYRKRLF